MTNVIGSGGFLLKLNLPITIKCDNQAAVASIKNNGTTQRNRHYERWLQYGREQYLDLVSAPLWIGTELMIADIFTKPLDKAAFLKFRAQLLNYKNA